MHTGDFKFDPTPPLGPATDEERLRELGDDGTLALFSDATRIERPGSTPSESTVSETLDRVIGNATGRVILTSFASNILRLEQSIEVASRHGRKVAVIGRSMEQSVKIASDLGVHQAACRNDFASGRGYSSASRSDYGPDYWFPG